MGTERPSSRKVHGSAGLLALLQVLHGLCACPAARPLRQAPAPALPASLGLPAAVRHSPELDEAAALLCARDTGSVIDADVRRVARVYDGQVAGLIAEGRDLGDARRALAAKATPQLEELAASHAGFAESVRRGGGACAALVLARRLLRLEGELPAALLPGEPFPLAFSPVVAGEPVATLYLLGPDGHVVRQGPSEGARFADVVTPGAGEGRYVLEVVLSTRAVDAPEVALLWPFDVGAPRLPPAPTVLFPDEGHGDVALSFRLEALIERLRNTQLLPPLAIAPNLEALARRRADALAQRGRLGHRLPDGRSAAEDLARTGMRTPLLAVSELQAQAGSLAEAWRALLESPAHRYELVAPSHTHLGAAVTRGQDALGRPLLSLVVVLAKKGVHRPVSELEAELFGRLNLARHARGRAPLEPRPALSALARELAAAMARAGALDEGALGAPAARLALERDAGAEAVRVIVARLDDPLRLVPPDAILEGRAAGLGLAPGIGGYYLCLIAAAPD